jgi:hypothetical protein
MIDIPSIKPLVTIEPVTVAGTAQNTAHAQTPLSSVPQGTLVAGFVINRDSHNQPILRTPVGDVLINTQLFLKTGTEVTIRVDNSHANLARIITINGQSVESFTARQNAQLATSLNDPVSSALASPSGSSQPAKPVQFQGVILQSAARETLPVGVSETLLKALGLDKPLRQTATTAPLSIILRSISIPTPPADLSQASPLPAAANIEPNSTLPTNTNLSVQALFTSPQQEATPVKRSPLPSAPTAPASQPPLPTVNTPNASSPLFVQEISTRPQTTSTSFADTPLVSHAVSISPAPTATISSEILTQTIKQLAPATLTEQQHLIVQGVVIGQEQHADTILHTTIGNLRLFTPQPLAQGSVATIEIMPHTPAAGINSATPVASYSTNFAGGDSPERLMRDWPALSDLITATQSPENTLLQNSVLSVLPTPNKYFTQSMLFFLSALKGGDIKQWLGKNGVAAIEKHDTKMLKHLSDEFTILQQAFKTPNSEQWISTAIPILYDNTLHQARLHIRDDKPQDPSSEKSLHQQQRFVIDVELSLLGEMQIDGLVQKEAQKHQFDMIIRTSKPLADEVEAGIRELYHSASEVSGFKGMILFQPSRAHFVVIAPSTAQENDNSIIA